MFTIDLLKGRGVPIKTKPGGVYLVAISFIVPVILAAIIFGNYLHNRILMTTYKSDLERADKGIKDLAPDIRLQKLLERRKNKLEACREEVADVINWHIQWSAVLQALVENIPKTVILDELKTHSDSEKKNVPERYPTKTRSLRKSVTKAESLFSLYSSCLTAKRLLIPATIGSCGNSIKKYARANKAKQPAQITPTVLKYLL